MSDKTFWLFAGLFFLSVFALFSTGHYAGDGLENYLVAQSIVQDGDFSIHDRGFGVEQLHYEKRGKAGMGGKLYSGHGVGMPFLLVPLYLIGTFAASLFRGVHPEYITQFFVSFSNPLICSAMAMVLILLLSELEYSPKVSFFTAFVFSFCTMAFVYSRSGFSEPAVALCFLAAAFFLLRYFNSGALRYLVLSGIFAGYAAFIKKNYALYIICFIFSLFVHGWKERDANWNISLPARGTPSARKGDTFCPQGGKLLRSLSAFAVPLVIYLLLIAVFDHFRFGGVFKTEYGGISDALSKAATPQKYFKAVFYFLFSSGKGFFFFNLPLVISLFGIKAFCKRWGAFSILPLSMILLNFGFHVYLFDRGTLFSWGPRYLFISIPFFAIFLAQVIDGIICRGTACRAPTKPILGYFAGALAFAGFLIQLPSIFINNSKWIFFVKEKLGVDEYMLNYLPDISPLKGTWCLFLSLLHRSWFGKGLTFVFDPDHKFIAPSAGELAGYDILDTWWFHVCNIHGRLTPFVVSAVVILAAIAVLSLYIAQISTDEKSHISTD